MKVGRVLFWSGCGLVAYVVLGTVLHRVVFPVEPIDPSLHPRAGDSVFNHLTGERFVFRKTHTETNGEFWEVDAYIDPHGAVPFEHVHTKSEEYFSVLDGVLTLTVAGETQQLGSGESAVVPPGTPHQIFNDTEQPVHLIAGARPALHLDLCMLQIHMFMLDQKEISPLPLLAFIATAPVHCDSYPAGPPIVFLQAVRILIAPAARILGFRGFDPAYSERARSSS